MLLKQEAALDMVSVGDVTSKLHRGPDPAADETRYPCRCASPFKRTDDRDGLKHDCKLTSS